MKNNDIVINFIWLYIDILLKWIILMGLQIVINIYELINTNL
jgi:hypothetical protein